MDFQLSVEIRKAGNDQLARDIIVDVIESQIRLEMEAKGVNFFLKMLMETNAKLEAVLSQGLRPDSKTSGAEFQLKQLEEKIALIRQRLTEHA
jgi:hypothetical protein